MTRRILFFLISLMVVQAANAESDTGYRLGSNDVISISVYGEPDLTFKDIRLNDSGHFSYPFLGEVDASGKTPADVERAIVQGLKPKYLKDPKVTVSATTYRSIYVSGEVQKPGAFPYEPGLTLERAIALAGGLTERASIKRVSITRSKGAALSSDDIKLSTSIQPGDTINIAQGFF